MSWLEEVRGDPLPWLLEKENPPLRYGALVDLLGRPPGDPEVEAARAAIPTYPPVAELLAAQKAAGYWVKRDYYLPKYTGTFWTLCVLGDLGLTGEEEAIRRACEYMFTFQRENGAFGRRRRVAGRGLVWDDHAGPCTQARIVRFLIQFGYGPDPRTRAGIDWLLAAQREDGWWDCGAPGRPGCLRATHDVLRAAALDAEMAAAPAIARGAERVCQVLGRQSLHKYHTGASWDVLAYPPFDLSLSSTLQALGRLGYTADRPEIAGARDLLLGRQLPAGAWPLDRGYERAPLDFGPVGAPNKWLTLEALRALRPHR
ncbi:MAG: hypothetical protein ACK2UY_01205 [Anaerolineae bacterium]